MFNYHKISSAIVYRFLGYWMSPHYSIVERRWDYTAQVPSADETYRLTHPEESGYIFKNKAGQIVTGAERQRMIEYIQRIHQRNIDWEKHCDETNAGAVMRLARLNIDPWFWAIQRDNTCTLHEMGDPVCNSVPPATHQQAQNTKLGSSLPSHGSPAVSLPPSAKK